MSELHLRRQLEDIHQLFQKIEREAADAQFSSADLKHLAEILSELKNDSRPEVHKLADLPRHFTPTMTLRTFVALMIPLERALGKVLRDDDFLISSMDRTHKAKTYPVRLALENLRSAFNVGSMLRSADGLGVEHVHLLGYTPGPDEDKAAKTALGAEKAVAWSRSEDIYSLREELPPGTKIIALETSDRAVPLSAPFEQVPTVFLLGNERFGLDSSSLAAVDEVRRLPMEGKKNSMNVGVLAALAIYEWKRQWTS